ncbi:hypothetical protein, partial [Terrimonas pollutisoli]|uniref:hypothetical protein n=1 Tax=Terrimonas pollutisoli TaxID=3034147 RepID=UPI0023EAAF7A
MGNAFTPAPANAGHFTHQSLPDCQPKINTESCSFSPHLNTICCMKKILRKTGLLAILLLLANLFFVSESFGQATVQTDKLDYYPGDYVIITGAGWTSGETVELHIVSDCGCTDEVLTAIADAGGNIHNNQFLITEDHLGASFVLTATGLSSGLTAQTTFTDGSWTITPNQTVCINQSKELTFSVTTTSSPNNGSFKIDFPASFTLSGNSISSVTGGKTWTSSISGSSVCLTRTGNNSNNVGSGDVIVFKVTVVASTTTGSPFSLSGFSNANNTACPATGTPQSSTATITVQSAPSVSHNTAALTVCQGYDPAVLTATVSGGNAPFTYQWKLNGSNIIGETNSTYDASNLNTPGIYSYTVVVMDACGNTGTSTAKTITVNADPVSPTINPSPADGSTVCVGSSVSATFSPGSGGAGTVTDTYEYSTDGGATWNPYSSGDPIAATVGMVGINKIKIRTQRTATGSSCNNGAVNTVQWTVAALPNCSITGADGPVCPLASNDYTAPGGMTTYLWEITAGSATIVAGEEDDQIATVVAGSGCNTSYTLKLTITDGNGCSSSCTKVVAIQDNTDPTGTTTAGSTNNNMCKADAATYFSFDAAAAAGGYSDNCGG